jgi:YbbR domain-containing protein
VRRSVPVKPELTGRVASGYEVYQIDIEPPMVEIEGPKSQVNAIDAVRTESIDLDGKVSDFTTRVGADHANHSIRVITPGFIKLEIKIAEKRKAAESEGSTKLKT